jgi:hypothetical protein
MTHGVRVKSAGQADPDLAKSCIHGEGFRELADQPGLKKAAARTYLSTLFGVWAVKAQNGAVRLFGLKGRLCITFGANCKSQSGKELSWRAGRFVAASTENEVYLLPIAGQRGWRFSKIGGWLFAGNHAT